MKYRYIRGLGAGVSGKVELYEDIDTGKYYALKLMNLEFMTKKEKESALSEVQFLNVLRAPTIIKFYTSFIDKNNITIVMEYAEKGNFMEEIERRKENNEPFTTK